MAGIGYVRVSSMDQNADLQHAALKAAGCRRIFTGHGVSGARAGRPELEKMLEHLRDRDEVVVWKLDRLGRNTPSLLALSDDLEGRGVHFRAVTEGISTTGPMGRAMASSLPISAGSSGSAAPPSTGTSAWMPTEWKAVGVQSRHRLRVPEPRRISLQE